jgi:hypothetical protein
LQTKIFYWVHIIQCIFIHIYFDYDIY